MYDTTRPLTATEMNAAGASKQYLNQARGLDAPDVRGVQQALNRLRTTANEVGICVDSLRTRLEPVMAPPPPEKAQTVGGPMPVGAACIVSAEIVAVVDDLGRMTEAIRSYMQRLEV
jgi:hypothetical protein